MRVGTDLDRHTQLFRLTTIPPIKIETMGVAVQLHRNSDGHCFVQDRFDVYGVGFAREQQPTRGVRENGEVGVVERRQHAPRHSVTIHAES